MDLMDQIDGVRFLGREWLLYLWYESERMGADDVEAMRADNPAAVVRPPQELFTPPGVDPFALYVTSPLVLEARFDVVERVSITGTEPSESNEARSALREGKLPAKLKLEIVRGERVDVGQNAIELLFVMRGLLRREREAGELGDFFNVNVGGWHGGR